MASGLENARLVPKVIGRAAARTCFIQNAVEHVPWTWTNTVHCNAQMHYKSLQKCRTSASVWREVNEFVKLRFFLVSAPKTNGLGQKRVRVCTSWCTLNPKTINEDKTFSMFFNFINSSFSSPQKKSRNDDTLVPVELIGGPKQGNQVDISSYLE